MKFWTVQTKIVVETVYKKGVFEPDFRNIRYLLSNEKLETLYYLVLKSFNEINNTDLQGLIFAFAQIKGGVINSIGDFESFCEFINNKKGIIGDFWK